jgi:ATP-dependent Lhr-like helicase
VSNGAWQAFDPLTTRWFASALGQPTAVQATAWPAIATGQHVLCTAPTGTGKTLTAFLWALDRLTSGAWPSDTTQVVYVSPLKALATDVRVNLLEPLAGISALRREHGLSVPRIDVLVRHGDTPARERQAMVCRPPAVLVTTPESLALLLLSEAARKTLLSVRSIVIDEVHAVAGNKRGAYLMAAVERLATLCHAATGRDPQRIALSATVAPLADVANWVGGRDPMGQPRTLAVIAPPAHKVLDLAVVDPVPREDLAPPPMPLSASEIDGDGAGRFWPAVVALCRQKIALNRATLFFCSSRRNAEKLARLINDGEPIPLAYAHHGSLSKEIRREVEQRLKAGELKALCATSSLELGIDIGSLDEVVLLGAPKSVSSALQRIGRAGHRVGAVSKATLVPAHPKDVVACAALIPLVRARAVENVKPVHAPLDVLAQVLLHRCCERRWRLDDLFADVTRVAPWHGLTRAAFDATLDLLLGRWQKTRLSGLQSRLSKGETGEIEALPGVKKLLAMQGGVIPDRGYFTVRVDGTGAKVGELDEEFVWERRVGDEFAIGAQVWRIAGIGAADVFVQPGGRPGAMVPFWRAEREDRGLALSLAAVDAVSAAESAIDQTQRKTAVQQGHALDDRAAEALIDLVRRQRAVARVLPQHDRVVIEHCKERETAGEPRQVVVHAWFGGKVLRPWAIALDAAAAAQTGVGWRAVVTDECIGLQPPAGADVRALLQTVTSANLDHWLRQGLGKTGWFGAQFRMAAGRALVVPRQGPGRRTPLWLTRQRAKRLLQAVGGSDAFPIVAEAWRACLQDDFDLDGLRSLLDDLHDGRIAVAETWTDAPSPFADGLVFACTNEAMYDDDGPLGSGAMPLGERVLQEVAADARHRPVVARAVADAVRDRVQRTALAWAPESADELLELVQARALVPEDDWRALLAAMVRDRSLAAAEIAGSLAARVMPVAIPGAAVASLSASLRATDAVRALEAWRCRREVTPSLPALLGEWLLGSGPTPVARLRAAWGLTDAEWAAICNDLAGTGLAVVGALIEGDGAPWACHRDHLERMLRLQRAARRPKLAARPLADLMAFRVHWHGLGERASGTDGLRRAIERLLGWIAPVASWETDLLPARVQGYGPAMLDAVAHDTDLAWYGAGEGRIGLAPAAWIGHIVALEPADPEALERARALLPDASASYGFDELRRRTGLDATELHRRLWGLAFAGLCTTSDLAALRQAAARGFEPPPPLPSRPPLVRALQRGRSALGTWRRLDPVPDPNPVAAMERDKDRARLLLDRHGVLFRELCAVEAAGLQWGRLLPALRLLELAGECVAGQFFNGVHGLQFALPTAVPWLQQDEGPRAPWTMAAHDPASLCGLGLLPNLPPRLAGTVLGGAGGRLLIVCKAKGRELECRTSPDDPGLPACLERLRERVRGPGASWPALFVDTIDGLPVLRSPIAPLLRTAGFEADFKSLVLRHVP